MTVTLTDRNYSHRLDASALSLGTVNFNGGSGDDTFTGDAGTDYISGGSGIDR